MELFDKKFVYLEWDDALEGKKVLVGDMLQLMRMEVNDNAAMLRHVKDNRYNSNLYPFEDDCGTVWALVYYDPNYSCKVAYEQGKQIQVKRLDSDTWKDCKGTPLWLADSEYRMKPEVSEEHAKPEVYKELEAEG